MPVLSDINDFIQVVAEAVADALEIETSVVDTNLVRIAGTAAKRVPLVISSGVIRTVMETGQYHITHNTRTNAHCTTCEMSEQCQETAFIHCPIFFRGQIIGVMGLMCFDDAQRERLVSKHTAMLNFVRHMCDIISMKMEEYDSRAKEQELYQKIEGRNVVLDQIINSISDGYVILDKNNRITNYNHSAAKLLQLEAGNTQTERLAQFLAEFDKEKSYIERGKYSYYEEIALGQRSYGVTVNLLSNDSVPIGKVLNFKTLDKIGRRAIRKAAGMITLKDILGNAPAILQMKELIEKSAENNLHVLISGESGTGKELVARVIHNMGNRRDKPFIAVNCAAIPETLLESELFGYEQGAFTGAVKGGKPGKFELAHTGTLFLDEIGDMPLFLQAKLLRVLQDFLIERLGSTHTRQMDVRLITATNQNLESMIEDGVFRRDLFYRLNVVPITLPPLRERKEDIGLLAEHFLGKYGAAAGTPAKTMTSAAMEMLKKHNWPGNVRELENVLQYLAFIAPDHVIDVDSLPEKLHKPASQGIVKPKSEVCDIEIRTLADLERAAIFKALERFGNTTEGKLMAARALGIGKTTLYRKLTEYGRGVNLPS